MYSLTSISAPIWPATPKAVQDTARVAHQNFAKIARVLCAIWLDFVFKIGKQPKNLTHAIILLCI
jgi:hypothetical protein